MKFIGENTVENNIREPLEFINTLIINSTNIIGIYINKCASDLSLMLPSNKFSKWSEINLTCDNCSSKIKIRKKGEVRVALTLNFSFTK